MRAVTTTLIELGFSRRPNDTAVFHGLVSGDVQVEGISFVPTLEEIEALNRRAVERTDNLHLTRISVGALARAAGRYAALAAGGVVGSGIGPLVVRRRGAGLSGLSRLAGRRVAVPGVHTTAHLLLRLFGPSQLDVVPMRSSDIVPAVAAGHVDAGVVIQEARLTYPVHDLDLVDDLGERWEQATGLALPISLVAALRSLAPELCDRVERGLRASVELARREPRRSRSFVREHATDLDHEACRRYVELHVNELAVDLGDPGRAAVTELLARAQAADLLPADLPPVWR